MNIQELDYSVNLLQALLWQYNDAPHLQGILQQKQDWYNQNQTQFWTDWYNNVFNLITANNFGLAVWSIILNVPLYLNETIDYSASFFGFGTMSNTYTNFNNGNFSPQGSSVILSTEEQRFLLRLRYFQLTTRGDIIDINAFLNYLFATSAAFSSGQTAWVLDGFDMTMTYVFNFDLSSKLRQLLVNLDILPRPAAVGLKYIAIAGDYFGFGTPDNTWMNFENGNFAPDKFI